MCQSPSLLTMRSFVDFFLLLCVLCLGLYTSQEIGSEAGLYHGAFPGRITFSREFLLSFRSTTDGVVLGNIPPELRRPDTKSTRRKRGRRGGIRRRLKNMSLDNRRKMPTLPSVLLSNVQSIRNKMDELATWASLKHEVKDTCLLAFTETWLSDLDRDEDLSLTGFGAPFRLDRSPEITNKRRGGGVCF